MAAAAAPMMGQVAGAAAGGPATSGSDQDTSAAFATGAKTANFGAPPRKNALTDNAFVTGGALLAVALVAIVWLKGRK